MPIVIYNMSRHCNFEDNIFIINMRIRVIRDLLFLDADPELFLDKTLEDVAFINKTLENLLGNLTINHRYIERDEQFHNLAETEWRFQAILYKLLNEDTVFPIKTDPQIIEPLKAITKETVERRKTLEKLCINEIDKPTAEPVVSVDELSELLKA